ncbi:MAG: RNA polymerase sigma factor [Spirochaetota bacterium]
MDETERAIDRILESADALSRAVFLMRRESGMTYAEIASSMDISERTAKRKMRKMLNLLSEGLKKAGIMLFFFRHYGLHLS